MKITLDALEVIEAIGRLGTFSLAGQELHKAPSSLSYVVQKLESDLGITVFDRSGHRVRLTKSGRILLEEGRQMLRNATALEERTRRAEAGWESELKIALDAMVPFEAMLPFISDFQSDNAYTRLSFSQDTPDNNWKALSSGWVDLIIGALGEPPAVEGLFTVATGSLKSVFVVSPKHYLASVREPVECSVLWQHQFVAVSAPGDTRYGIYEPLVEGQKHIGVPNLDAKVKVIVAGIACGYLPSCVAQSYLEAGSLVSRRLSEERPPRPLHLAWRGKELGHALGWWIERREALTQALRKHLHLLV